jgi:CMP-N,N'-diacetyllegionaminic acid synthase
VKIIEKHAWGFITARGGSKSIPLKNILPVNGKPLIEYSICAAQKAKTVQRIICSTDHGKIIEVAKKQGVDVVERPKPLCGDIVPSIDVVIDAMEKFMQKGEPVAEIIVLIQPTSIFLTSEHIDKAVNALLDNPLANSSQTVVKVPHQFHAHNQRHMSGDGKDIYFVFPKERETGFNKQTKPEFYCYGNLIVTRTRALMNEKNLFARPSIPVEIPRYYAYDLDTWEDVEMAEIMIHNKLVQYDAHASI